MGNSLKKIGVGVLATGVLATGAVSVTPQGPCIINDVVNTVTLDKAPIVSTAEALSDSKERGNMKAKTIADVGACGTYESTEVTGITIEIVGKVEEITEGDQTGVQVFAKAWKDGKQLGFGKDGSVEIERFRFFNPPILVPDDAGSIVRTFTDTKGTIKEKRYKEDPREALKTILARTANLVGKTDTNIEPGKIGNTTDTFNPSYDGKVQRLATDATWTAARDTADGTTASGIDTTIYYTAEKRTDSGNKFEITRVFIVFNTSTIADTNNVDSGYLEIESDGDSTSISPWGIIEGTPASESTLVVGDYDAMTINSPTRLASDVTPSGSAGTRNTWTLNSSGYNAIDKTGNTVIVVRAARDIDNVAPTARSYWAGKAADTAGTVDDPLLSVTHSAGAAAPAITASPILFE